MMMIYAAISAELSCVVGVSAQLGEHTLQQTFAREMAVHETQPKKIRLIHQLTMM